MFVDQTAFHFVKKIISTIGYSGHILSIYTEVLGIDDVIQAT